MKSAVEEKVSAIFRELAGGRAQQIDIPVPAATQTIAQALAEEYEPGVARQIAFHLTDWQSDAAFIMASILYPERFTPEDIRSGVGRFIVHAPNHAAAAAKLGGYPVADIFEIGALEGGNEGVE